MTLKHSLLTLCFLLMIQVNSNGMAQDFNFEKESVGAVPMNWTSAKTGSGNGSVWKIQEDISSPMGKNVLVQTSSDGPNPLFNLCIANQQETLDVDFAFSLKAISGKTDQGGGPVWRYQDENNYYVARANPLENNFRLYKVIDGKRTLLATADVSVATNVWHKITVEHHGNRIQCSLNGKVYLDVVDESIKKTGRVTGQLKPLKHTEIPGFLSAAQIAPHHTAHYGGALKAVVAADAKLEEATKSGVAANPNEFAHLKRLVNSRGNSVVLHESYFDGLAIKQVDPPKELRAAIEQRFGSLDKWSSDFISSAKEAAGWAMLVKHPVNGKLYNIVSDEHAMGVLWMAKPLVVIDTYEHAFYIDYQNRKAEYIEKFMSHIDWAEADRRRLQVS